MITFLLNEQHSEVFEERLKSQNYRPLFFKNKIQKCTEKYAHYFYRSAPEIAFRAMQRDAVESIIQYIIKYQNCLNSSFMFKKLLPQLLERGI